MTTPGFRPAGPPDPAARQEPDIASVTETLDGQS